MKKKAKTADRYPGKSVALGPDNRKHPRRKPLASQRTLTLRWNTPLGGRADTARLVDLGPGGLQIELSYPLEAGQSVTVQGEIDKVIGQQALNRHCHVTHCKPIGNKQYAAGLAFDDDQPEPEAPPKSGHARPAAAADKDGPCDYYEVLQVNPKANLDTIHRVYHFLALRYHPDNQETGNADLFRQISEAHEILTDPERRAAHDVHLARNSQTRFRIFENWESSRGKESEKRKRSGVLDLLYSKRLSDPERPSLSMREMEDLLACAREHLEFTLWFLREKKWVLRNDNNHFEITILGVEAAEEQETSTHAPQRPLLAAPANR